MEAIHSSSDQDYDSRDKKTQDPERVGYQQRAKMTGELQSSHICHVHMKLQAAAGWLRLGKKTQPAVYTTGWWWQLHTEQIYII